MTDNLSRPETAECKNASCCPGIAASDLQIRRVREEERTRLARELHDELGSILTAAKLELACVKMKLGDVDKDIEQHFQHLNATLNAGLDFKSRIVGSLSPSSLGAASLGASLDHLAREFTLSTGIPVTVVHQGVVLPESTQLAIYRMVQESLTNVGRYAHADKVRVSLLEGGRNVVVVVADKGRGFDPARYQPGKHGIAGMRQRVEECGGQLRVTSTPGKGTRICAVIPRSADGAPYASIPLQSSRRAH
ncbi:sensor histidine kinase [Variovorax beijingensis]|uniref:sensor histidine kinase n=1 Tax=Variovorax beijingensis TaxID=2496117 RepID=UPI003F6A4D54